MGLAEDTTAIGYVAYCENVRFEAPTLAEVATGGFALARGSREPLLFQARTATGERDLTDAEDAAFRREHSRWLRGCSYTEWYDSPGGAEGTGRDP